MEDRWGTRPSDGLSTGEHCQVVLMSIPPGGADVIRQALRAGHVEELAISIAPVILAAGSALFEGFDETVHLEHVGLLQSPFATQITYRIVS